ncbi:uncharacterized protein LOC120351896 isoform X2 [Nilaparvata lugens]|uniref:uncharacterized protein LOC120351896 isoform X2 n=1 Tax=Nilaparvata lugens TaxID=108931 RepID=UPI00193D30E8|nr:uncharacterized protein LOC120351896 isoform X2 [Nilaparvata lugens]
MMAKSSPAIATTVLEIEETYYNSDSEGTVSRFDANTLHDWEQSNSVKDKTSLDNLWTFMEQQHKVSQYVSFGLGSHAQSAQRPVNNQSGNETCCTGERVITCPPDEGSVEGRGGCEEGDGLCSTHQSACTQTLGATERVVRGCTLPHYQREGAYQ